MEAGEGGGGGGLSSSGREELTVVSHFIGDLFTDASVYATSLTPPISCRGHPFVVCLVRADETVTVAVARSRLHPPLPPSLGTLTPYLSALVMCTARFSQPFRTKSRFSSWKKKGGRTKQKRGGGYRKEVASEKCWMPWLTSQKQNRVTCHERRAREAPGDACRVSQERSSKVSQRLRVRDRGSSPSAAHSSCRKSPLPSLCIRRRHVRPPYDKHPIPYLVHVRQGRPRLDRRPTAVHL